MVQMVFKSQSGGQLPFIQVTESPIHSSATFLNKNQTVDFTKTEISQNNASNDALLNFQPIPEKISLQSKQSTPYFMPQYINQNGKIPSVGVTFAEEAKAFQTQKKIIVQTQKGKKQLLPIYIRQTSTTSVPVINGKISGSRFISDSASLLNYCVKWCKNVYFKSVILRAVHNTGTLLLIFPGKSSHYVQFVYNKSACSDCQRLFREQIFPAEVKVFHSFTAFADWMKKQFVCHA